MNNQPLGILDSGVGGLTIWKEIAALLPHESTVYIADSKNCPYGTRSQDEILKLVRRLVAFLVKKRSKIIVVACNTITGTRLTNIKPEFPDTPITTTVSPLKTPRQKSKRK